MAYQKDASRTLFCFCLVAALALTLLWSPEARAQISASTGAILGTAVVVSQATAASINGLSELVVNFNQSVPANLAGAYVYATDANGLGSGLLMERNTVQQ